MKPSQASYSYFPDRHCAHEACTVHKVRRLALFGVEREVTSIIYQYKLSFKNKCKITRSASWSEVWAAVGPPRGGSLWLQTNMCIMCLIQRLCGFLVPVWQCATRNSCFYRDVAEHESCSCRYADTLARWRDLLPTFPGRPGDAAAVDQFIPLDADSDSDATLIGEAFGISTFGGHATSVLYLYLCPCLYPCSYPYPHL